MQERIMEILITMVLLGWLTDILQSWRSFTPNYSVFVKVEQRLFLLMIMLDTVVK